MKKALHTMTIFWFLFAAVGLSAETHDSTNAFSKENPIDKNAQTITFDPLPEKTYGDAAFELTATASSGLEVSYTSSNTEVATISGKTVTIVGAGTTDITASQEGDAVYDPATEVIQTLTVSPKSLLMIADDIAKEYDGLEVETFTVTLDGLVNEEGVEDLSGELTFTGSAIGAKDVGDYEIIPGGLTSTNYDITFVEGLLRISKKWLLVTASPKSKVYGEPDPTFTAFYHGFVNGEDASVLGGELSVSREPGEDVGEYTLTPSGYTSDNYEINYSNGGTLFIYPAPLEVIAPNAEKMYGQEDPDFTVSYSGFAFDEDETVLEGTLVITREPGEDAGTYEITASGLTADNYTLTFIFGELEITPAPLTISAQNQTKNYGDPDPELTYLLVDSELVGDDTLSGELSRNEGEDVGTYPILIGTLDAGPNYQVFYEEAQLVISPRSLVVSVTNTVKTYGTADPAFEVTYDTFAFSEDVSALNGTLTISREPGEEVGTYAITASGLSSGNYTITYEDGELEITPAELTVTAQNATKIYGENDPEFTAAFDGFQWEDDADDLDGTLVFTREPGEYAGTYAVTASGLT
ncbi:MAG: MBG domain-containing protein, partial [bacterium]